MLSGNDIKTLCFAGESSCLDYKSEQYHLSGKGEDAEKEKSKFLKDVLAFANSYRTESAYILLGIEENDDCTGRIKGVDLVLDNNVYQQLVTSKTNKPITFSSYCVTVDGNTVQVIEIPVQNDARPFFSRENFGKVAANEVYCRVGTTTIVAKPDMIRDMGVQAYKDKKSTLEVSFMSYSDCLGRGSLYSFDLKCDDVYPSSDTEYSGSFRFRIPMVHIGDSEWDVYKWYRNEIAKVPIFIGLKNVSDVQADNIKIKVSIGNPKSEAKIVDCTEWENHPTVGCWRRVKQEQMRDTIKEKNLCPGEELKDFKTICVATDRSCEINLKIHVYGKNIDPFVVERSFIIERYDVPVSKGDLSDVMSSIVDRKTYLSFLVHLLGTLKTAQDNGRTTPSWELAFKNYRAEYWGRIKKELGF